MSLKHKLNSISPLKIGFVASFALHSSLFAFLVVDFKRVENIKSMPSQALSLSLEHISGANMDSQKIQKKPKKPKLSAKTPIPPQKSAEPVKSSDDSIKNADNEADSMLQSSSDSNIDSTLGTSANVGEQTEILSNGDALYATIMDIINKNRHYPKMAIRQKLTDRIQVEFILLANGEVVGIRIVDGRHRILNNDAIDTIKRSATQFPKMERSKKVRVIVAYDLKM